MHVRKLLDIVKRSEENDLDSIEDRVESASDEDKSQYQSFNWRAGKDDFDELIQVTDEYVVHARGFTVENEVWLDEYAVRSSHSSLWQQLLQDEYGGSWRNGFPNQTLYWSVTGTGVFLMQYPRIEDLTDEALYRLAHFLKSFNVSGDTQLTWKVNDDESATADVSVLYDLIEG